MALIGTNNPSEASALKFRLPTTVIAWLGLVGYLVLAKVILALLPPIEVAVIAGEFT